MKKIKNKFILIVIWIIFCIVGAQSFVAYSNSKIDTNSYLSVLEGTSTLNEVFLEKNQRYILQSGDKISVGEKSLALIEWGEGSLTRLGENTKISIEQNQISRDYTKIQISFDLIAGKTWSNVISFFNEESSFTQSFQGIEAGVRGTVFDVDLTADYISVQDHQVQLKDTKGNTVLVEEGKPLKISTFTLIEIQEFLSNIQDQAWLELNKQADTQYVEHLKNYLAESLKAKGNWLFILDYISPKYRILYELDTQDSYESIEAVIKKLDAEQKQKVYQAVLSRYQDFNFVSAGEYEFYKRKVLYQKALLDLAGSDIQKQNILKHTAYDIDDMLDIGLVVQAQESIDLLLSQKDLLQDMNLLFLTESLNLLPQDITEKFQSQFETLKTVLPRLQDLQIGTLKETAEGKIQDFLNSTAPTLLEKLKNK